MLPCKNTAISRCYLARSLLSLGITLQDHYYLKVLPCKNTAISRCYLAPCKKNTAISRCYLARSLLSQRCYLARTLLSCKNNAISSYLARSLLSLGVTLLEGVTAISRCYLTLQDYLVRTISRCYTAILGKKITAISSLGVTLQEITAISRCYLARSRTLLFKDMLLSLGVTLQDHCYL